MGFGLNARRGGLKPGSPLGVLWVVSMGDPALAAYGVRQVSKIPAVEQGELPLKPKIRGRGIPKYPSPLSKGF
jgi:hypothetical protein